MRFLRKHFLNTQNTLRNKMLKLKGKGEGGRGGGGEWEGEGGTGGRVLPDQDSMNKPSVFF